MQQIFCVWLQNTYGQTSHDNSGLLLNLTGKLLCTPVKFTPEGTQPALEGQRSAHSPFVLSQSGLY